jgi:hypothetical protein
VKIGTIGGMNIDLPGGDIEVRIMSRGAFGGSSGRNKGEIGGSSLGVSNTSGVGSSGNIGVAGGTEMRFPQRVLDAFFPSLISVSPLKSFNFLLVQ